MKKLILFIILKSLYLFSYGQPCRNPASQSVNVMGDSLVIRWSAGAGASYYVIKVKAHDDAHWRIYATGNRRITVPSPDRSNGYDVLILSDCLDTNDCCDGKDN